MAPILVIRDGNPIWVSDSIRPSKDTVVPTGSSPTVTAIKVSDTNVNVYVKVENQGTEDIGLCTCTATGLWGAPTAFAGYYNNGIPSVPPQTQFGVTFTASATAGDRLTGGVNYTFNGAVVPDRRAWAWSPDGRYFAYVYAMPGGGGRDWNLVIVALQDITRTNGTVIRKGTVAATAQGVYVGPWNQSSMPFAWIGSRAVLASGTVSAGTPAQISVSVTSPESINTMKTYSTTLVATATRVDYVYRVSPCASFFAIVPRILNSAEPAHEVILIDLAAPKGTKFRKNNAQISVSINGLNPSITTNQHTANGVIINQGSGATVIVDDPECTFVGGGVQVHVDRVKQSTLPGANNGVVLVGEANVSVLLRGSSVWVKVPNVNGWFNQSEPHWCLLAQTYTSDGTTIARPWNGQAVSPPPYPISDDRCAQRNIAITT